MSQDDQTYFERRAEAELELAQKSQHEAAVSAHYQLASSYLDRIFEEQELTENTAKAASTQQFESRPETGRRSICVG